MMDLCEIIKTLNICMSKLLPLTLCKEAAYRQQSENVRGRQHTNNEQGFMNEI